MLVFLLFVSSFSLISIDQDWKHQVMQTCEYNFQWLMSILLTFVESLALIINRVIVGTFKLVKDILTRIYKIIEKIMQGSLEIKKLNYDEWDDEENSYEIKAEKVSQNTHYSTSSRRKVGEARVNE